MFIRIAIAEDETPLHDYYSKMIEAWGASKNVRIMTTFVESSEEYLFKYDKQNIFDIIFLDVCMKDMNGMELAHEIRKSDRNVQIWRTEDALAAAHAEMRQVHNQFRTGMGGSAGSERPSGGSRMYDAEADG
mgnify:CR=1 FL=1